MKNLDLLISQPPITQVTYWATVTQASPLRVQLDGDPGPLPLTPDTLVAGLQVSDRVRVELATNNDPMFRGRRVVVVGKSGGIPIPQAVPAGVTCEFAGSSAPTGWLLCDGSAVSRSMYADLFTAIGTTHGAGNGSTTFNVPDMRGRVPVGRDSGQTEFDTLGESGGAKTHTLTEAEMPSHNHQTGIGGIGGNNTYGAGPGGTDTAQVVFDNGVGRVIGARGGGGAHNNLQPYRVLNFIIKT